MSSSNTVYVLFRGILKDFDEDDMEDEIDFGEFDSHVFSTAGEIDRLQPNRFPYLELDYLGNSGDAEMIFRFKITWMDREADMEDYLDEVQDLLENNLNMLMNERQWISR